MDNPKQDLPLVAVLSSVFAKMSNEDLAIIRSEGEGKTFYDRMISYQRQGEDEKLCDKIQSFLHVFLQFRKKIPYTAIHTLLAQIMEETGFAEMIAAMPAGQQRIANVEMLIEKAIQFESTSYKGLFHFVRYIEQLHKYDVDYGEASIAQEGADVVRLMSIHKSKGLEFPIVFVAGMEKEFNLMDIRSSVVIHSELGVGLDFVDVSRRVKAPTILKKMMQREVQKENVSEELRVLYVALTRAKEKLIMTGTITDFEEKENNFRNLTYSRLITAKNYLDWVLPACFHKKNIPIELHLIEPWELEERSERKDISNLFTKQVFLNWDTDRVYDENIKELLEQQFSYSYPYAQNQKIKQKMSVSELKKRSYLEEEEIEEEIVIPLLPRFAKEKTELSGASRGTAYHKVLEILDFTKDYDKEELKFAINEMVIDGLLAREAADSICLEDLLQFFDSSVGKRVKAAARNDKYHAEQPFVLGEMQEEGEMILVQGIIDVYFEEEEELVVLDYKTDRIWKDSEFIEKYKVQLDDYAKALERMTGKRVKEKIIYAFHTKHEIFLNK